MVLVYGVSVMDILLAMVMGKARAGLELGFERVTDETQPK